MSTPKRHPLTLAVAVALGLGSSQIVSAAEFTVTNTDDSGAGSLRQAIDDANTSGDASNTIVFDAGLTGETITLASVIFVENNSLTIQGPGPQELIIEQEGHVLSLRSSAASVAISGLTLRHTDGSTSIESPLFSHSPSLDIDNVHFRGESAGVTNFGYGGGCLISSQWTTQAGGVQALNISNSEFDNCRTSATYPGGAIFAQQSSSYGGDLSVTIENTVFQNGSAGGGAGALIRQSTFDGSNETSHAVTIDGLTATNNSNDSVYGGYGVLAILQDRDSSLDIDNLDMSGNIGGSGGSALEYSTGRSSTASIRNASFLNNDAGSDPILLVDGFGSDLDFELVGSRFSNAMTGSAALAVALDLSGGDQSVSIRDSLIHGSEFDFGAIGSGHFNNGYGGDSFELVNTTITDNLVGSFALAIDPPFGTVDAELRHVTITDNTLMGGEQPQGERGEGPIAPAMVRLGAGGTRRITNSILHGVSGGGPLPPPPQNRGVGAFDLTSSGEVDIDHSLIGLVDPNVTVNDLGGSFIDDGTDPSLLALADNGGQSQTRAFTVDSPVFDAGNPAAADLPAFDQRGDGFSRVAGNAPDMGAFELQVAPEVSLDSEGLDFPDTRVQTTSDPLDLEVSNTGDFELNISEVATVMGVRGTATFIADGSDCTGAPIPPGESCSIGVTFTPGSRDNFTGSLEIATDADPENYSVALTGTGVAPIIDVAPNVNFGTVVTDTTSGAQTITIDNTGDDALEVTGFDPAVTAPFSLDFSGCGASLPFSVPAGASCDLSATFSPTSTGSADTTVTVQSDSLNSDNNQFSLTGEGVSGQLSVSPGDIDFGEVAPGESGEAQVTLSNDGSAPVTVDDWTSLPEPFSISGDCPEPPFTLDPGESCTLTITFSPESPGDYEQGLVLGFDDGSGAGSTQVNVAGRGTAPEMPATPVPTLDRIGLIIGSGLLALMGLLGLRRQRDSGRLFD
ncbi:MAG: choice-of-anchor D domain-containing protein [Xanthomonadales bacterium]|nr:choice-of-anchor D domain-containing protein [Xanthomonadales bacterium]